MPTNIQLYDGWELKEDVLLSLAHCSSPFNLGSTYTPHGRYFKPKLDYYFQHLHHLTIYMAKI